MKKLINILISTRTMAVLLFVLIALQWLMLLCENDFRTPTAKLLIYETKWFESIIFAYHNC